MDAAVAQAGGSPAPFNPTPDSLEGAILQTLAYVDVFDYPLTLLELQRYLIAMPATLDAVDAALARLQPAGRVVARGGFFALPGRAAVIARRKERRTAAALFWRQARAYGRRLARLPFVRMVAVTGSLASDNVDAGADIDFFIVSAPDRLWLCRALTIGVVRLAAQRGAALCPNFFISTQALALPTRNLYAARELAQMVPLSGLATYRALRAANAWSFDFLPNAAGVPRLWDDVPEKTPGARRERLFPAPLAARLEGWEQKRKLARFTAAQRSAAPGETHFSADICQGHFDGHGERTLRAYEARLRRLTEGEQ